MSTAMASGVRALEQGGVWALVPIKAFDNAKTRLAEALSARQRHDFARAMAARVIGELRQEQDLAASLSSPATAMWRRFPASWVRK